MGSKGQDSAGVYEGMTVAAFNASSADPEWVLSYWFGSATRDPARAAKRSSFWFEPNPDTDAEIARLFAGTLRMADGGVLESWQNEPRSCLALVILLDQFPRNLHRGSAQAYEHDHRALLVARTAVQRGDLDRLHPLEQTFLLMPYHHAEDLEVQREGVALFRTIAERASAEWRPELERSLDFALRHLQVIERFGRFPHRNAILARESSPEEQAFLDEDQASTAGRSTRT